MPEVTLGASFLYKCLALCSSSRRQHGFLVTLLIMLVLHLRNKHSQRQNLEMYICVCYKVFAIIETSI